MGALRIIQDTNANRLVYGGLEEGRMFIETDTDLVYIGTSLGDVRVGSAGGTSFWDSDALPETPSDQDDHFEDGALDVKWSEYDPGVANLTVSVSDTFVILTHPTEATGPHRGIYQTLPAGDFSISAKIQPIGTSLADNKFALALFEDATDSDADLVTWGHIWRTKANDFRTMYIQGYTDYTTFSSSYWGGKVYQNTTCYIRIRRNGTDLFYDFSCDGVSWDQVFTHAQPFDPAHMGLITSNYATGTTIYLYCDLFRYIASDDRSPIGRLV